MDMLFTSLEHTKRRIASGIRISWWPERGYVILLRRPGDPEVELAQTRDPLDAVSAYKLYAAGFGERVAHLR